MFKREDVVVEPEYYLRRIEVICPDCRCVLSKGHWTVCVKTRSDRYWVGHVPPIECCRKERKVAALFDTEAEHGITISTDRAIPIALIVNELITNAAKYAYRSRPGGTIRVRLARANEGKVNLSISDEGEGLPVDFDPRSATGLGMRIVRAFLQ